VLAAIAESQSRGHSLALRACARPGTRLRELEKITRLRNPRTDSRPSHAMTNTADSMEPSDVETLIEKAFAHDREGRERQAIRYYDLAYQLGVPADKRRPFLVGYGSTLRNVGRSDDAVGVLAQAIADDPGYPPFVAFLGLALLEAGHPREAIATLLGCALDVAPPRTFDGFERALGEYQRKLLDPPA
jgi:tetratricopeptide (TPR) repeat protein